MNKSKITSLSTALFMLLIIGQVFIGEVKAVCQCPNTPGEVRKDHKILWGTPWPEPSGTCAICPGASCTGCSPAGGGGQPSNPASAPASAPIPKPQPFTMYAPASACSGTSPYIDLSWSTSTNATYYKVYRSDAQFISGNLTTRSYRDSTVASGKSYYYYIYSYNNNGDSASASAPSSTIASICDNTPPSVHINWNNPSTCFTPLYWKSNLVQPITIHVDDVRDSAGGSVPSSGIVAVYARLHSIEANSDSPTYSATIIKANSDGSFEYSLPNPFEPDFLSENPAPRNYTLTAYATDNAGHEGNSQSIQFKYDSVCTPPHIQTQNGDVHSQTSVGK